ncbi:helix-turn-helix domain-containing protein, partial [Turicimonas muris]
MSLLTLKIFESVLRNGNFLAASKENNCSQSSVSFHIKNLEEFLGVQLFEK